MIPAENIEKVVAMATKLNRQNIPAMHSGHTD